MSWTTIKRWMRGSNGDDFRSESPTVIDSGAATLAENSWSIWSFDWLRGRASAKAAVTTFALIAALVTFGAPGSVIAAGIARNAIPDHAIRSEFGSGWECMHGYQRARDACVAIALPKDALRSLCLRTRSSMIRTAPAGAVSVLTARTKEHVSVL